jgi:Zn-dependent peptidase ImmA (M78 family)
MVVRVDVRPELLQWAVERSGRSDDDLWTKSFPRERFESWLTGEQQPTPRQLKDFANKTYTPVGFLYLAEPPQEGMPLADFRAGPGIEVGRISADLRETVYDCQDRQDWYRDHRLLNGAPPMPFVGSASLSDPPSQAAESIAEVLDWSAEVRRAAGSWSGALAALRDRAEVAGVLVVISGIVGANTRRKLDTGEFKGFALVDEQASLAFVNGADYETSKIFSLAHELAHVWLGSTGLSNLDPFSVRDVDEERWCNRVAAELLVPAAEFQVIFDPGADLHDQLEALARQFRVSTQVILGRVRELGHLGWDNYLALLRREQERVAEFVGGGSGGNFYNTKPVQMSKRFARELIASTLEGRTSYKDAFRLLNVKKQSTFDNLGARLGVS